MAYQFTLSSFSQGGIYTDNGAEYNSSSVIRSGMINAAPCSISVTCPNLSWVLVAYDSNHNFKSVNNNYWLSSDTTIDLSEYSWIKYIRIELHNATELSPPQSCILQMSIKPEFDWHIDEDAVITNKNFIPLPENAMTKPYPLGLWRIDETVNDGFPYHELLPEIVRLNFAPYPGEPQIQVYDSFSISSDFFAHNGLAIIEPTECIVRTEKNGMYSVNIKAIADEKSKYLTKSAVLKIPIIYHGELRYQLFRSLDPSKKMESNGVPIVEAEAPHIFYDLNGKYLEDVRPTSMNGKNAIGYLMDHVYGGWSALENGFSFDSDIARLTTAYYEDMSLTEALIGADNSVANRWGGSIYRNNFFFSINRETEQSRSTGAIVYSQNMESIEFESDSSECVTRLIAKDNFGNKRIFVNNDVPNELFPFHITKCVHFTYDAEDTAQLEEDGQAYFDNYKQPRVSIRVKLAELPNTDEYKGFTALDGYEVGDKTIVYHKELGINFANLEVIATEYDVLNKIKTEIEIGTFQNAISRERFMAQSTTNGASAEGKMLAAMQDQVNQIAYDTYISTPITTADGKYLTTSDGKFLLYKEE